MDKLKFFRVVVFATDGQKQAEILLPIDAISHLTQKDPGNPRGGYNVHVKENYPLDKPFPIKSYNVGYLSADQVEILKLN